MNESVSVTPAALIRMRPQGEGLALPITRVRSRQAGNYLSPYKGRGMEFEEHRQYQSGDDVRNIDWRVTARMGAPYTKVFREERERPVLFCVDFRRSMFFATRGMFKTVVASRAAAMLAWSSNHHGDRVGGVIFAESEHHELRPQRGKAAVLKMIQALVRAGAKPSSVKYSLPLDQPFARLRRVARPGSLVCVISDFRGWNERAESHLVQIAKHNSVWLLLVVDPVEAALPAAGVYRVTDDEREAIVDTRDRSIQKQYAERFRARHDHLKTISRRNGMSLIEISTQADLPSVLRNELMARGGV